METSTGINLQHPFPQACLPVHASLGLERPDWGKLDMWWGTPVTSFCLLGRQCPQDWGLGLLLFCLLPVRVHLASAWQGLAVG